MMKGFEITINEKSIKAAVDTGVVLVTVDEINNKSDTFISTTCIDNALGVSMNWGRIRLSVGDKIKIKAIESEMASTPLNIETIDRNKLLAEYHSLKDMLTKEGIIE